MRARTTADAESVFVVLDVADVPYVLYVADVPYVLYVADVLDMAYEVDEVDKLDVYNHGAVRLTRKINVWCGGEIGRHG